MARKDYRSALDPPDLLVGRWTRWLRAGGGTGSLQEMEQQYMEAKGYDNWPEYFSSIGIRGNFHVQKRKFWAYFSEWYAEPPPLNYRLAHYLATTRFGAWYI